MDEVRLQPIRNSDLRTVYPEDDDRYSRDSRAATNLASEPPAWAGQRKGLANLLLYSTLRPAGTYGLYRVSPATGEDDVWFDRI
jgi:hypothetical protein